ASNDDEGGALRLMKEVQVITSNVPGPAHARANVPNKNRGFMCDRGLPSFHIMINSVDVYLLVKFLIGAEIDIGHLLPDQVPNFHDQSIHIARNPAVTARLFNTYMKAFIKCPL
ncbi:uncharacterized protein HD556DRAFT_1243457, partial [Suillus plorans]